MPHDLLTHPEKQRIIDVVGLVQKRQQRHKRKTAEKKVTASIAHQSYSSEFVPGLRRQAQSRERGRPTRAEESETKIDPGLPRRPWRQARRAARRAGRPRPPGARWRR